MSRRVNTMGAKYNGTQGQHGQRPHECCSKLFFCYLTSTKQGLALSPHKTHTIAQDY